MDRNSPIVCIGGGHGLLQISKAMLKLKIPATYIVTVFDDGGSTGKLRDIYNIPALGDIRKLISTLTGRYDLEEKIGEHKKGNLVLLNYVRQYGFLDGILKATEEFNVFGKIIPISEDNSYLCVKTSSGKVVKKAENRVEKGLDDKIIDIWLEPEAKITKLAKEAIENAKYIFIGPGSFFGSVMVHFCVRGFIDALENSKGKKYFILNISKDPEIYGYEIAQDLINFVKRYTTSIDYFVINREIVDRRHIRPIINEKNVIFWDFADKEYNRHNIDKLSKFIKYVTKNKI